MKQQDTPHILDAHPNTQLRIKPEYMNENGNLDIEMLLDDIDVELMDHSDIDTLRAIRHVVQKRVEYVGDEQ